MDVKIKKVNPSIHTVIPKYAKPGDCGLDLTCTSINVDNGLYLEYGTNLALQLPSGHVGLIFPRSSISNYQLSLSNSVGVIDVGYTGEIKLRFRQTHPGSSHVYKVGDKIAQLVIVPLPSITLVEVDELSETERGSGSFGSSGV